MDFINKLMCIIDPLVVAFIISVLIGILLKNSSGLLMAKYTLCTVSALAYLGLCVYANYLAEIQFVKYLILYSPVFVILLVFIISMLVAPKGNKVNKEDCKINKMFTGYESMFPNDIDNK